MQYKEAMRILHFSHYTKTAATHIPARTVCTAILCLASILGAHAQRIRTNINANWHFRFSHEVERGSGRRVDLPHTWNTADALAGRTDYKRGIGNYTRHIFVPESWRGQRVFLRCKGANSVADVFVNGRHIGEHRGGYEAFVFELTDRIDYGKDNTLLIRVNNGERLDVMPLVGDFNFYGGLYRDVDLLVTGPTCISPLDCASPGIYLIQDNVTDGAADITAKVALSNNSGKAHTITVRAEVSDGSRIVASATAKHKLAPASDVEYASVPLHIDKPHLWNGTADPFVYTATVSLWDGGKKIDEVAQPLGLRYFSVDADRGFMLNGRHVALHGVCRHQDAAGVGNALHPANHDEDIRLIREIGANAIRLSHYPQDPYFISQLDSCGIVAWSEIPFVGPGGYLDKGFVDSDDFKANGRQQLREMIRQLYNHPSICFWGLFNELKAEGDNPVGFIRELNDIAHAEDPTRLTTAASNQGGDMNFITDLIAWNRYDGWYGSTPKTLATFLDNTHRDNPKLRIAISEYGAGASPYHQQDSLVQTVPTSWWHPENWQTYYHERNWEILSERPFVWGTFVWNMFDFGAAHRTEGDRPGFNDKGLVTFDRKLRKDAFYYYKANWNPEPMLWIAGKRTTHRKRHQCIIEVFSNTGDVTLKLNGTAVGTVSPDKTHVCRFSLTLRDGDNTIEASAGNGASKLTDSFRLTVDKDFSCGEKAD